MNILFTLGTNNSIFVRKIHFYPFKKIWFYNFFPSFRSCRSSNPTDYFKNFHKFCEILDTVTKNCDIFQIVKNLFYRFNKKFRANIQQFPLIKFIMDVYSSEESRICPKNCKLCVFLLLPYLVTDYAVSREERFDVKIFTIIRYWFWVSLDAKFS